MRKRKWCSQRTYIYFNNTYNRISTKKKKRRKELKSHKSLGLFYLFCSYYYNNISKIVYDKTINWPWPDFKSFSVAIWVFKVWYDYDFLKKYKIRGKLSSPFSFRGKKYEFQGRTQRPSHPYLDIFFYYLFPQGDVKQTGN